MTHEQKPESAEFRTREAQVRELCASCSYEEVATAHILEAEARGAAEQRRKDAEEEPVGFTDQDDLDRVKKGKSGDIYSSPRPGGVDEDYWPIPLYRRPANVATGLDISAIIRAVCELPDRSSPEDQPDMMLVTPDELRLILETAQPANVAALEARVKELEGVLKEAARALEQVTEGERGGYNARNGKFVCLRMSDGERADIIHCEVTEDCECALRALRSALREGGEHG